MDNIYQILRSFKDYELAFYLRYQGKSLTKENETALQKELIRRKLNKAKLQKLISERQSIKIKNHNQMICPRCTSSRILSERLMDEGGRHEGFEVMIGFDIKPKYKERRYCSICYWDFSRNKTIYDRIKSAKRALIVFLILIVGSTFFALIDYILNNVL